MVTTINFLFLPVDDRTAGFVCWKSWFLIYIVKGVASRTSVLGAGGVNPIVFWICGKAFAAEGLGTYIYRRLYYRNLVLHLDYITTAETLNVYRYVIRQPSRLQVAQCVQVYTMPTIIITLPKNYMTTFLDCNYSCSGNNGQNTLRDPSSSREEAGPVARQTTRLYSISGRPGYQAVDVNNIYKE